MSEILFKYLKKDPISYIHVIDLLDRNNTVIYESCNGFIVRDDDVGFIYMSFDDDDTMKDALKDKRYKHYISYDKRVVDYYGDSESIIVLDQFVYNNKNHFDISEYDIRLLGEEYADLIDSFYKAIGPGEKSIDALRKNDVLGIFENNTLAGIIGRHPEGCIGMLHVFEQYRKKGYGEALEKAMINKTLDENKRVFCEVVSNNEISLKLQRKLGYLKGEKKMYWLV